MSEMFQTWLESNDCYEKLLKCSAQVLKKARRKSICLEEILRETRTDDLGDLNQIVAHEMWQFFKTNGSKVADRAIEKLVHGDSAGFMEILIYDFLDHCKDKRRTYGVDPVYAYFRSLRDNLSRSEEVNYRHVKSQGSFYAFSFDEFLNLLPHKYWGQPYHNWFQPKHPEKEIYSAKARVVLARIFWDEFLTHHNEEYFLPIKELLSFLLGHYRIGCSIEGESNCSSFISEDEASSRTIDDFLVPIGSPDDSFGYSTRQNPLIEMDIIETELEQLSSDCIAMLTEVERTILIKTEEGLKMADIAKALDMKRPSNVSYHQRKVYEKLKRTWSLWGPSLEEGFGEVEEEEFWIFYDKVIEICKTTNRCRES